MNDQADDQIEQKTTDDNPSEQSPPEPAKKKKLFRWWGLGLLGGSALLGIIGAEFGFSHTVRSQLTASLTDQNMVMSDTTDLSASLLGGSIAMDDLVVTDVSGEEARTPYKSDELRLDIATLATWFGSDYTIERLASNGTEFDFRRRPDGSIPGIPPEIDPTHQPGSSEQAPETDLISLAQSLHKRWEQIREYDWVLDKIPSGSEEEAQPAVNWNKAVYYAPPPTPPSEQNPPPRIIIRELDLQGDGIALPNTVGTNPDISALDIQNFSFSGQNVSLTLYEAEEMTLQGTIATHAAGSGTLSINRKHHDGTMSFEWKGFPLSLLSDPQLAGKHLGDFKAQGTLNITLTPTWDAAGQLSGQVVCEFLNLELEGSGQAQQASQHMRQFNLNNIVWELPISGTLSNPEVEGLSVDNFMKTILRSTKDAITNQVKETTNEVIKEGKTEAKEAVQDEVKDLLHNDDKSEKKDPKDRINDVESNLKDRFGL